MGNNYDVSKPVAMNAGAAITKFRILKFDTVDGQVVQAAAATDKMLFVSGLLGADASGDRLDVWHNGCVEVEYGGTVTRGDLLTADANGKAIATTTANDRYIGIADVSGVAGDIGSVWIQPGQV